MADEKMTQEKFDEILARLHATVDELDKAYVAFGNPPRDKWGIAMFPTKTLDGYSVSIHRTK